jgi:hypothetical protein
MILNSYCLEKSPKHKTHYYSSGNPGGFFDLFIYLFFGGTGI